jgi:Zinc finger, C3HC4 type (RING finger)/CDK-activating kinase assembly factor MAT1
MVEEIFRILRKSNDLRLVSRTADAILSQKHRSPLRFFKVMSGMQNGHIPSEADGETLKQRFTQLSLRLGRNANTMTEEDICPVCKNSTYLQKNLRFKINTKCYHRICEGCVDRITSTQKKCPIAGCPFAARGVIPRRTDYRVQTFEDLAIEREVDIRKRVMAM